MIIHLSHAKRMCDAYRDWAMGWPAVSLAAAVALILATGNCFAQTTVCLPERSELRFPVYSKKVAKIGVNPIYPPFSFADPADMTRMTGLDVEIVEESFKCAGLRYEFFKGQTSGLYPALVQGTLDVMVGNIFIRPDRVDKVGFVLYMTNGQSLTVRKGNPKKITHSGAMCGLTATGLYSGTSAVVVRDISKKCVEAAQPPIEFFAAADQEQAYRSLSNDRTDMVMDGSASAAQRVASSDQQNLEIAFTLQTDIKSGVIAPKGNAEMMTVLGEGLRNLQSSGRLAVLMQKYGLKPDWLIEIEIHP